MGISPSAPLGPSPLGKSERQPLQSAQKHPPPPAQGFGRHRQTPAREATQEGFHGYLSFHPGEWRPQAMVHAAPSEGEVPVWVAGELQRVRVLEMVLVVVGRAKHRQDQLAPRYRRSRDLYNLARV